MLFVWIRYGDAEWDAEDLGWVADHARMVEKELLERPIPDLAAAAAAPLLATPVRLPRLSNAGGQGMERFTWVDNNLVVIPRPIMQKLYNYYDAAWKITTTTGLYLHGPVGAGKSYAIYVLVCYLRRRALRDLAYSKHRILYIQDCDQWQRSHVANPFQYLMAELIYAFGKDGPIGHGRMIVEWANYVMSAERHSIHRQSRFGECWDAVKRHVEEGGLLFTMVFDQLNAIYKLKLEATFPYTIFRPTPWQEVHRNSYLSVVSASANNEGLVELPAWTKLSLDDSDIRYSEAEFKSVVQQLYSVDPKDRHLERMEIMTGRVPYEVKLLFGCHKPTQSLDTTLETYINKRATSMEDAHQKFRSQQKSSVLGRVDQCIAAMALEVPQSSSVAPSALDRQLMFWNEGTSALRIYGSVHLQQCS
jgi:hypothetical protein